MALQVDSFPSATLKVSSQLRTFTNLSMESVQLAVQHESMPARKMGSPSTIEHGEISLDFMVLNAYCQAGTARRAQHGDGVSEVLARSVQDIINIFACNPR